MKEPLIVGGPVRFQEPPLHWHLLGGILDKIYHEIDCGSVDGALFLDLAKAFNMVDHALPIEKSNNSGFHYGATLCFES